MAVVRNTLSPVPADRVVTIRLVSPAGWRSNGTLEVITGWSAKVDEGGLWAVDLPPQSTYVVAGTWYQVTEPRATHSIVVPDGAGPHQLYDLLVDPVPTSSGWAITPEMAQLRDATALAGATDGQVPTWDEDMREWVPGSGGGGVSDHGALTGLSDDDHLQYHTDARGDARYPPLLRTLTAGTGLTGGGNLTADRTLAVVYGTTPGTAAQGNDPRFSDAPIAHAASHQGGSDPVTPGGIGAATAGHDHSGIYEPTGLVSAHEAAGDPHPTYLTQVEGDARYALTTQGSIYPLEGYGFHSATCAGTEAMTQSSWSSWHTRIWVPANKDIVKVGMVVVIAGVVGAGGLNAFAVYSDSGQSLLGQTPDTDNFWATAGLRELTLLSAVAAASSGRFVRVIANIDGYNSAPSVPYCTPAESGGATLNGTGSLQRRTAFKSAYIGSFPATIDPDTLGTPTNFLPFILLG